MASKSFLNAVCIALLPFLIFFSGYFLVSGKFFYAMLLLLSLASSVELRVRMGYRGRRGPLFFIHLACGGSLLLMLAVLSLRPDTALFPLAFAAFLGTAITGIALVRGSWKRIY